MQKSKHKPTVQRTTRPVAVLFLFVSLGSILSPAVSAAHPKSSLNPVVLAYVFPQKEALTPTSVDPLKLSRINYAFANLQQGRIVNGFGADEQNFATLVALKRQNPSLAVLVSIGGWAWSDNFSDMTLTRKSRDIFIQSVLEYISRYHLDGLDLDWEYPGMIGNGHRFRPEDKANFTSLLKELRQSFDRAGRSQHRHLLLTIAAGASSEYLAHTEMGRVQKYVDTVNLMAYDYYEPTDDHIAAHHAPLFTNPADPKAISVDRSVREFLAAGVPASKLVVGVPFYGHAWGNVEAGDHHGLYQSGATVPNAFTNYTFISGTMLNQGFTRYWDPVAYAPYLYNPETRIFVSYEDPESLARKCRYVLDRGLAGIMFWDYESDATGKLLETIDTSLHFTHPVQQHPPDSSDH